MRKANIKHLLILILTFAFLWVLDVLLQNQNVEIRFFDLDVTEVVEWTIVGVLYGLILTPSVIIIAKKVHDLFIKYQREVKLVNYRIYLFLASLITGYSFLYFDLQYVYLIGLILLVMIYFATLMMIDKAYVNEANKVKIKINDEVVTNLLNLLGGEENVLSVSFEYSRLKVDLQDVKKVDLEGIKALGATGLFVAGNKLQAIVGNNAKDLEIAIKKYLTHS